VFVISFIADISNRKKNEESIRKLNAELEEKIKDRTLELKKTIDKLYLQIKETNDAEKGMNFFQQLFHQVVDNYPAGSISVLNTNYQYIFCGGVALAHHCQLPQELIGKRFLPEIGNTYWQPIQEILEKVFEGQTVSDFEMPNSWKEQSFSFDAFPLTDNDGNISRIAIITRNTSALKKVEKELQEALIKEKELSSLKSRFISIASHEFRTPLSTVLSSAYLLEKYTGSKEQPKREKHIERIVTAVNSLTDILNDFLSVGRIEEGRVSVKLTNFNIPKMVAGIIDELNPIEKKGQTVAYTHSGSDEMVLDPSILKHIITNLLSNAIKFSQEDKVISIKTNCDYSGLDLIVADDGIGIPDADKEHLYERFFRATNVSNIQGTGLGLHIVSRYAELLEGTIQCKSALDKGTTFELHFPSKNNTIIA
jgi:signal transduction histidine kinase